MENSYQQNVMSTMASYILAVGLVLFFPLATRAALITINPYANSPLPETRLIYVAPGGIGDGSEGLPFGNLQDAAASANPGDTIVLRGGTYTSAGAFSNSGTASSPITIRPFPGEKPVFDIAGKWDGLDIAGSYLTFEGLEINQINAPEKAFCVWVTGAVRKGITLRNMSIHNCETALRLSYVDSGVDGFTLEDTEIRDNDLIGIDCAPGPCDNVTIRRSWIHGNGYGDNDTAADGVAFEDNSSNIVIEDSETDHNGGDGFDIKGTNAHIIRSYAHHITRDAIKLWRGGEIVNSVVTQSGFSVTLMGGADYDLTNNTFAWSQTLGRGYALTLEINPSAAGGSVTLRNNLVISRDGSIGLPSVEGGAGENGFFVTFRNNLFWFLIPGDGIYLPTGRFVGVDEINAGGLEGERSIDLGGNRAVDPLISEQTDGQAVLLVGSPALDAGARIGAPTTDIRGAARPYGIAVDIGAYEYGATPPAPAPIPAMPLVGVAKGSLVKGSAPAVYYYAANSKRYVFPDEKTYKTWYSDFSEVTTISDSDLASLPLGGNVTCRPGTRMIKIQTDPKVYAVDRNGIIRWVTSEALAVVLYGSSWNQMINDVSDAFFVNYYQGSAINSASDYSPSAAESASPTIDIDKNL